MKTRLLLVDADALLARLLRERFEIEGFEVQWAPGADEAILAARTFAPDLILLDVLLPGRDGFELLSVLRAEGPTPVIILTSRGQKTDKLSGLRLGADDYVTKPFDADELVARVEAVLRRARPGVERLDLGPTQVDFRARVARRGGRLMPLTHREFELLQYLAERHERVVHRDELLREVWGYPEVPATRSVDHAIARLRKKIEPDPHRPRFIHTVQGTGYRFSSTIS